MSGAEDKAEVGADVNIVTSLGQEASMIKTALTYFEGGGKIVGFTIQAGSEKGEGEGEEGGEVGSEEEAPPTMTISSVNMEYPDSMVDTIRQELEKRLGEIKNEINTAMEEFIGPTPRK